MSQNETQAQTDLTYREAAAQIKAQARFSLLGHLPVAVGSILLYLFITFFLAGLAASATDGDGLLFFVLSQVAAYLVQLVIGVLKYGLYSIFMDLQYRQPAFSSDVFRGFRENPYKIMQIEAILSGITLVCELPASYLVFTYSGSLLAVLPGILAWEAVALAASIAVSLFYGLVWFVLLDYPELTWKQALQQSRRLMDGNRLLYLYILVSFIPLYLLGLLSFGVALPWISSYRYAAEASFYRGIIIARRRN